MIQDLQRPGLFRLFLALLVVVNHTTRLYLGTAAVYVFFVLSGYWICVMWRGRYRRTTQPYATYLVSRAWRLLPVFVLCSAIAWAVVLAQGARPAQLVWFHQLFANLVLIGYRSLSFQANAPAWSLDVEMQFYILAPLLVAALSRSLWLLAVIALLSGAAWLAGDAYTAAPFLILFALGATAATTGWQPAPALAWASLLGTGALVAACARCPWSSVLLAGAHPGPLYGYNGYAELVVAALLVPWAIHTVHQPDTPRDGMFGDLSFLVYLLHWPVIHALNIGAGGGLHRALMTGLAFLITLGGAVLLWAVYDRPINRLRARWVRGRLPDGSVAGA